MRATVCCLFVLICAVSARTNYDDWRYLAEKELRALERKGEAPYAVKRHNRYGCYHVADFGLVIDSSSSIHPDDFEKGRKFIAHFADGFNIGPNHVRFAAITFSKGIHREDAIRFGQYTDKGSLLDALRRIPHRAGSYTETGKGIRYMRDILMQEARPDVAHFGIVITDGNSQEPQITAAEAQEARESGITMIAIGVGKVNDQELENIASGPNFIMRAENYSGLDRLTGELTELACEVITTPKPCS